MDTLARVTSQTQRRAFKRLLFVHLMSVAPVGGAKLIRYNSTSTHCLAVVDSDPVPPELLTFNFLKKKSATACSLAISSVQPVVPPYTDHEVTVSLLSERDEKLIQVEEDEVITSLVWLCRENVKAVARSCFFLVSSDGHNGCGDRAC